MSKKLPGEGIFKRLSSQFRGSRKGQIVVIDPRTGQYFIGKDELAVALRARKENPRAQFSVFRIGYPSVHKFRKHHS